MNYPHHLNVRDPVAHGLAPFSAPPFTVLVAVALLLACQGDPPAACGSVPEQSVFVGQTVELQPCFQDPEGEELTLTATSSDPEIAAPLVSELTVSIRAVSVGSATITVTASDPDRLTASIDIKVVVPNRAPFTTHTPPAVLTTVGDVARAWADEAFKDPDGHDLTFSAASATPAIATVEIVDSVYLVVRGIALGTATVTVTATDPWGSEATLDLQVEVLELVLVFRDDFESSASLDDWTSSDSSVSVKDGMLRLGSADRDANATDWELTLATGFADNRTYSGFLATNRGQPSLYNFSIGYLDMSIWEIDEETNYRLLVWAPGWRTDSSWWGVSDAIAGPGELTEVTFAVRGGRLAAMAGSTLLVTVDILTRDWPNQLTELRLIAESGGGFVDWVELSELRADADADWHAGPLDTDLWEFVKTEPRDRERADLGPAWPLPPW